MLSATLSNLLAVAVGSGAMPPLLVEIGGGARIQTPGGATIVVPEGSTFTVSVGFRLDPVMRELYLDNRGIFKDGFE